MIDKNLILLAYGSEQECRRAIFCILSFLAWNPESIPCTQIIVYTDRPAIFKKALKHENVAYVLLSKEMMEDMLAGSGYFHRIKVAVTALTFENFPERDVLFIDADTFFISPAREMMGSFEQGKSFMHKREYSMQDSIGIFTSYGEREFPDAFLTYIDGREFPVGGQPEIFGHKDYSWNSGVLGLHRSFIDLMPDVFKLTDAFYQHSRWFVSEQLAFSFILQRKTSIFPADKYIIHYWAKRQKIYMDALLDRFLTETPPEELSNREWIRSVTRRWKKGLEIDTIFDHGTTSLRNGNWYFGFKKILQLLYLKPKAVLQLYSAVNRTD